MSKEESPFIIKNEKYSIDIIAKYQTPNGISHKGITIYKKNCEINFLNNESLSNSNNLVLNKNDKTIIYSFANIGFISISDIICFLYLTKNDILLVNNSEENIFYKVKNLHYIKMVEINNLDKNEEDEKFKKEFEQFKKFFINENLFFSFCKYGNNILNHHIESSNNHCYNEKYFLLFKQSNSIDFITPLISGFYKHLIINEKDKDENNNINKKDKELKENNDNLEDNSNYLTIDIIIKNIIKKNENDFIIIDDIINEKDCSQEIQIDIYSNIIDKKINYKFYSYYGETFSNNNFLYKLFKDNKNINKGLILTVFDFAFNKNENKNKEDGLNEINKENFDIEITNDSKKDNIKKFIYKNIDKIKNIFEKEKKENEEENSNKDNNQNDNLLIISGSNNNSIFNLTQEIIHSIIYFYFDKYLNKDNNNDKLLFKVKSYV